MNLKLFIILFTSLFLLAATDINNGKDKSATCVACHGKEGNSQVGLWPSIAGQNKNYLMKQLKLIKKGERAILEMNGLLDGFSDADLEDISAYYAGNATKVGQASADMVDKGFKLYYAGSLTKGIPACTACHSPRGLGNDPAAYPLLSGQQPAYIIKTLNDYRAGTRKETEASRIMVSIAYKLDDSEIKALASFIHGLH